MTNQLFHAFTHMLICSPMLSPKKNPLWSVSFATVPLIVVYQALPAITQARPIYYIATAIMQQLNCSS